MDTIDLGPFFASSKKTKNEPNSAAIEADTAQLSAALINKFRTALCNCGFLFLTGHGISQSIIDEAFASARSFFARPIEQKKQMSSSFFRASRGYSAVETENFATLVGEVCQRSKNFFSNKYLSFF